MEEVSKFNHRGTAPLKPSCGVMCIYVTELLSNDTRARKIGKLF